MAVVVVAEVLAMGVAGGCRGRTRRTPDDTIVFVAQTIARDIDPRFALTNQDTKLSRLVVPGLMTVDDESLEPRPMLAEWLRQVDDTTWEARLRSGLVFSDGTPVTADDVAYTFESVLDPALGSLFRKNWAERLRSVEVVDSLTARFHLVEPVATLPSDLDFGVVSKHAALAGGGKFRDGRVIGAGPYRVQSFHPERVVLERNPRFAGPPPPTEKVEVRTIRDANARLLVLVGGSADLTQNTVRLDLIHDIEKRDRLEIVSGPSAILTYLLMQNEDPALSDVRVRRAIAHAIDRDRIITAKFHGYAVPATGLLPPGHWAYRAEVPRYPYDPDRARALLDEAGFVDPDGPGGAPRLRLTYKTSADQFRLAIARIIAAQLGEVGIEVEVRSFEFGTFFADVKQGNYQLATMQTPSITEPDYYYAFFHSERIPNPDHPDTHNRWRYRNARVDELTARGRQVADREERIAIYHEIQELVARDIPIVALWHEDNVAVMNVDVDDYFVLPNAGLSGLAVTRKQH